MAGAAGALVTNKTVFVKVPEVPGLVYCRDFLTQQEHKDLVRFCASQFGSGGAGGSTFSGSSVVQSAGPTKDLVQYGYTYHVASKSSPPSRTDPIPAELQPLVDRFVKLGFFAQEQGPDQVILRQYPPGAGISAHVDHVGFFGDTVAGISLGSATTMEWTRVPDGGSSSAGETKIKKATTPAAAAAAVETRLPPRSAYVMQGEARFGFTHAIRPRKTDKIGGVTRPRGTRFSLTFRHVKKAACGVGGGSGTTTTSKVM